MHGVLRAIASNIGCAGSQKLVSHFHNKQPLFAIFYQPKDSHLWESQAGGTIWTSLCTFWSQETHGNPARKHANYMSVGQHQLHMCCLWTSHRLCVRLCLLFVLYNFILHVWAIMSRSAAAICFSHEQPLCIGSSWLAAANLDKPAKLLKLHGLGV